MTTTAIPSATASTAVAWIFGPLGAALNAGRYLALAAHPGLREESDGVDAAEEALDDTVPVDDPRVAQVAAERHAFERRLGAAMEESGQEQSDEALLDAWDALHPAVPGNEGEACQVGGGEDQRASLSAAIGMMPYDYSPARLRCMELTAELISSPPPPAPTQVSFPGP